MRTDAHQSLELAKVRDRPIARHAIHALASGRGYVLTTGLGPPRVWSLTHEPLARAFEAALAEHASLPAKARVRRAFDVARQALAASGGALIERRAPDAAFLALVLDQGIGHFLSAGTSRAYVFRHGDHRRMTPDVGAAEPGGVLEAEATHAQLELEPADVILLGSRTAFTDTAVEKVSAVMRADPETSVAILATLLTEPARPTGAGAAAVVLRVR